MAIGVALFAIGVGCLVIGLTAGGVAGSAPRAGAVVAPPREPESAPALSHSGGRRATPDRRSPPILARPRPAMDREAFGAARAYLLEMSARLRHTTLGADAATRAAVAADVTYAYAWLGATDAAPAPRAPRAPLPPPEDQSRRSPRPS